MHRYTQLATLLATALGSGGALAADPTETSGDIILVALPATALGLTFGRDDAAGRKQFYAAAATSVGATYALKYSVDKQRPDGGDQSFPSGHSSTTFMAASFIQLRYGWAWGTPAYLAAAYTGWSRVESKRHWPEDVYAGAAIGIASSWLYTQPLVTGVAIAPVAAPGYYGVTMAARW